VIIAGILYPTFNPMEINYIILAHKSPKQVARLIEKLTCKNVNFYIHIDKDVDLRPFELETGHLRNAVFLRDEERTSAVWADFSMVRATLNCMRAIVADGRTGYCILISGQDYPISDSHHRASFLERHNGVNFIEGTSINKSLRPDEGVRRIDRYKINLSKSRNDILLFPSIYDREFYAVPNLNSFLTLAKRKSLGSCLGIFPTTFRKRKFPDYVRPYIGSQWWALPMETIKMIINFIQKHPDYVSYHAYTFAPDEIFFHSIIFSEVSHKFISDEITYVNWPEHTAGPLVFNEKNFSDILDQREHKLFARKFDCEIDYKIMDLIDRELL
jgi:hypothetical protein